MNLFFIETFEMALPISCVIGILLLISPLIKKSYVAKWRYYMWLFIAVRLIIPYKISIFSPPVTMEVPASINGIPAAASSGNDAGISLQTILMLIWLAGMAVFILYQLTAYSGFKRTVKRWAKPLEDKRVKRFFEEIKASIGEKRRLDIKICKAVSTPMVFGFIRPVLLLPECGYSDRELYAILKHELIHFKRNDILYKLVLTAANALNWFNPLVYLMVSAANKDIELVCDAEVVKEQDMDFRRDYCRAILSVIHSKRSASTPLSTCFIISKKVMKERFRDILDIRKKRRGILLFTAAAVSAVISGSIVTFATEQAAEQLEDNMRIVERPTPKPLQPTEVHTAEPTPTQNATTATPQPRQSVSSEPENSSAAERYGNDANGVYDTENSYPNAEYSIPDVTPAEPESAPPADAAYDIPSESTNTDDPEEIEYESIGDPVSVSSDGSKATYNTSDGNTVIVQYDENNEIDTGYILVD